MIRNLMRSGAIFIFTLPVQAQGIDGGTLGFEYGYNADRHISQTTLGGSLGFGLGGLSLQGDLAKRFSNGGPDAFSLGAHVLADVGSTSAVGAFVSYDDLAGAGEDYKMGVEGKFAASDRLGVEAYLMRVNRSAGRSDFGALGLDASFGLSESSAINAGFFRAGGGTGLTRYSLGVGYDLSPTVRLNLDAARLMSDNDRDSVFGLSLGYTFGNGATFSQRDYPHLLPGF